jgi:predicted outer membrane repeat protein
VPRAAFCRTGVGGGAAYTASSLTAVGCNFTSNSARYGGAIAVGGNASLVRCRFAQNRAKAGVGGAVHASRGDVGASECAFERNSAGKGPGGGSRLQGLCTQPGREEKKSLPVVLCIP